MSQYGMQMPGAQMRRGASMNVYTGLLLMAAVALAAACGFLYYQGKKVGKGQQHPFAMQDTESGQVDVGR